jgi:hypothetical protein
MRAGIVAADDRPRAANPGFQFSFVSDPGHKTCVLYSTNLLKRRWQAYSNPFGDGTLKTMDVPSTNHPAEFFRGETQSGARGISRLVRCGARHDQQRLPQLFSSIRLAVTLRAASRDWMRTGLVRCASKPTLSLRARSCSMPYPVRAIPRRCRVRPSSSIKS